MPDADPAGPECSDAPLVDIVVVLFSELNTWASAITGDVRIPKDIRDQVTERARELFDALPQRIREALS